MFFLSYNDPVKTDGGTKITVQENNFVVYTLKEMSRGCPVAIPWDPIASNRNPMGWSLDISVWACVIYCRRTRLMFW